MITAAKAAKLRPFIDAITGDAPELDDIIATLEDPDIKGEDRESSSDDLVSAVDNLYEAVNELKEKLGG